jgi:hypothetical protein
MAKPVKSASLCKGKPMFWGQLSAIVQQLHSVGEALRQQAKKVVSE